MNGAVFMETLRRNWRQMLYWGIGIGSLALFQGLVLPDVDALNQMAQLMQTLPAALIESLGGGDAAFMSTPEGYLSVQFFGFILIVFAVYSVLAGLNVTANEEDQGIMDVMLSLPVSRSRLIVEKVAAYTLIVIGIIILTFLGLWIGVSATPALQAMDMGKLIVSLFNVLPGTLVVFAFTTFIATAVRRRTTATGIASAFVVGSYFIDFLGRAAKDSFIGQLRVVSFYSYYDSAGVMQNGLSWGNVILLVVVSVVLIIASLWMFNRRDIGV